MDGLVDPYTAKRLIRMKVRFLDDALKHTAEEQQAKRVFEIRRGFHDTNEEVETRITQLSKADPRKMKKMENT